MSSLELLEWLELVWAFPRGQLPSPLQGFVHLKVEPVCSSLDLLTKREIGFLFLYKAPSRKFARASDPLIMEYQAYLVGCLPMSYVRRSL